MDSAIVKGWKNKNYDDKDGSMNVKDHENRHHVLNDVDKKIGGYKS